MAAGYGSGGRTTIRIAMYQWSILRVRLAERIWDLLDNFKEQYPKVLEDLIPNMISPGLLLRVMQNLLREQVPILPLVVHGTARALPRASWMFSGSQDIWLRVLDARFDCGPARRLRTHRHQLH